MRARVKCEQVVVTLSTQIILILARMNLLVVCRPY